MSKLQVMSVRLVWQLMAGLCLMANVGWSWVADGQPLWLDGAIHLAINLDGPVARLSDGKTYDEAVRDAAFIWNEHVGRVQFVVTLDATAPVDTDERNGHNNVTFTNHVAGERFGDGVLAITLIDHDEARRLEADVFFNQAEAWDSYRGTRTTPQTPFDLQRVALHELGHVLGLGHPNEAGQWQLAVMRSPAGSIEQLTDDDKDGAAELYGVGRGYTPLPPAIRFPPNGLTVEEGSPAQFRVDAPRATRFQWKKDGTAIVGATAAIFRIDSTRRTDAGDYSVDISNIGGTTSSLAVPLIITPMPVPTIRLGPESLTREAGQYASFTVYADRATTYQWFRSGTPIAGATSERLVLTAVFAADAGDYTVEVGNLGGTSVSAPASLTVDPARPPTNLQAPTTEQQIPLGEGRSIAATAEGTQPITFQWFKDGVAIPSDGSGALPFVADRAGSGSYHVVASNAGGSLPSAPFQITVLPVPRLAGARVIGSSSSSIPEIRIGLVGSTMWSDRFQWYHNGVAIPGATQSSFSRSPAAPEHSGDYLLVITNAAGSIVTTPWRIDAPLAPPIAPEWRDFVRHGDIGYFLFREPARVERYHFVTRDWLTPLPLDMLPFSFAVGDDGIYASEASQIRRFPHNGGPSVFFATPRFSAPVHMFLWSDFLVTYTVFGDQSGTRGTMRTFRRTDGTEVDATEAFTGNFYAITFSPHAGMVIGRPHPSGQPFFALPIGEDGRFKPVRRGSNIMSGSTDLARLSPDGRRVFAGEGTVSDGFTLADAGDIGAFRDIAFTTGGQPVVLRGGRLALLDARGVEQRTHQLRGTEPSNLVVHGDSVALLTPQISARGVEVTWVDLTELNPPAPPPVAPDPELGLLTSQIELGRDGVVYLLSPVTRHLLRWSTANQAFLRPFPLRGVPTTFVYAAGPDRIVVGYPDGAVTQLDPSTGTETSFAFAPAFSGSLVAMEDWLIAGTTDPNRHAVHVWDWRGARLEDQVGDFATATSSYSLTGHSATRRIIAPALGTWHLAIHTLDTAGSFAATQTTTLERDISEPFAFFTPAGDSFLLAHGQFYEAATLAPGVQLGRTVKDAVWRGGQLLTIRDVARGTELTRWAAGTYVEERVRIVRGSALRVLALADGRLLVVSSDQDRLIFTYLDVELAQTDRYSVVQPSRLVNLSARAWVGTEAQQLIPGFVISGAQSKRVLVRASGPSLQPAGVAGFLVDPQLTLYNGVGQVLAANDDWNALPNLAVFLERGAAVGANPFLPDSRDSGLLATLAPGPYSAHTSGVARSTGISVVEVFDADPSDSSSRLVNISARARVGWGEDVLIVGFVIAGEAPAHVLIHGLGPKLASVLPDTLQNPVLTLYGSSGTILTSNDDWRYQPALSEAWKRIGIGALPTGSKDAALLVELPPGLYSVHLRGDSSATGVGMIELYEVPED